MPALGALIATISSDCVAMPASTLRANITMGTLELIQVLRTGFLSGKPFDKLVEAQSFLFGHFWRLPFDASILPVVSNFSDTSQHLVLCLLKPIT